MIDIYIKERQLESLSLKMLSNLWFILKLSKGSIIYEVIDMFSRLLLQQQKLGNWNVVEYFPDDLFSIWKSVKSKLQ